MPTLRESIGPILAISIAAAILMLLLAQLDATEWANGFRVAAPVAEGEGVEAAPAGIISFIGPLIKVSLLMGIPALITLGVRKLLGRVRS